jgi:hypothetical protein
MKETTAWKLFQEAHKMQLGIRILDKQGKWEQGWFPGIDECVICDWLMQILPPQGASLYALANGFGIDSARMEVYLDILVRLGKIKQSGKRYMAINA